MREEKTIIILMFTSLILFSFANKSMAQEIKIGDQTWSTKNLDVSTFRNGDSIPEMKTPAEWQKAADEGKSAWCYYQNQSAIGKKFGKLYNWYAVIDPRGIAPKGWHIPSDVEWTTLTDYLGGERVVGKKMKSVSGWDPYRGKTGNGNNISGFDGLPGGIRANSGKMQNETGGAFNYIGYSGYWWSTTRYDTNRAWYRSLNNAFGDLSGNVEYLQNGFSVRCIKD